MRCDARRDAQCNARRDDAWWVASHEATRGTLHTQLALSWRALLAMLSPQQVVKQQLDVPKLRLLILILGEGSTVTQCALGSAPSSLSLLLTSFATKCTTFAFGSMRPDVLA